MKAGGTILGVTVGLTVAWAIHGSAAGVARGPVAVSRVSNVAATRRYLASARTTLIGIDEDMGAVDASIRQLVTNARTRCPRVAERAPAGLTTWRAEAAIGEELGIAAAHAEARPVAALLAGVKALRWQDRQVNSVIQRTAIAASTQTRLREPELCGALREWASSGFRQLPSELEKFNGEVERLSETSDVLPGVLHRYEAQLDPNAVRQVENLDRVVAGKLRVRILYGRREIASLVGLP